MYARPHHRHPINPRSNPHTPHKRLGMDFSCSNARRRHLHHCPRVPNRPAPKHIRNLNWRWCVPCILYLCPDLIETPYTHLRRLHHLKNHPRHPHCHARRNHPHRKITRFHQSLYQRQETPHHPVITQKLLQTQQTPQKNLPQHLIARHPHSSFRPSSTLSPPIPPSPHPPIIFSPFESFVIFALKTSSLRPLHLCPLCVPLLSPPHKYTFRL